MDEVPVLQGWVARESNVVDKLINKRFGALYPSTFVTYRKETDDVSLSISTKKCLQPLYTHDCTPSAKYLHRIPVIRLTLPPSLQSQSPSKAWSLSKDILLSPVSSNKCNLRKPGASTLWAVASGAYELVDRYTFSISWSHAGVFGSDELTLAFETKEEADKWHINFNSVIENIKEEAGRLSRAHSNASETSSFRSASLSAAAAAQQQHGEDTVGELPTFTQTKSTRSLKPTSSKSHTDQLPLHQQDKNGSNGPYRRAWSSVLHINGVAVYSEEVDEDGEGGAIMVSAVVRAPPVDVFRQLVQVHRTEGMGIFTGAKTLEVLDATTQVVSQTWAGTGFTGAFVAPREMVLLRTWRQDEDGTYIVLYQSTKHRAARPVGGWGWKRAVRAEVPAAGFTVAPLLPRYVPTNVTTNGAAGSSSSASVDSPECLVTLVLKADLKGLLSEHGLMTKLLSPLAWQAQRSLLEPVVTSIIILRDTVEQNRFVVRPLSNKPQHKDQHHCTTTGNALPFVKAATTTSTDDKEARKSALKQRTATMLAYRRQRTMREEQEEAATSPITKTPRSTMAAGAAGFPTPPPGDKKEPAAAGGGGGTTSSEDAAVLEEDSWAVPGTCPAVYWSCPGPSVFKIRGPTYLTDKKKVEATPPMFELVAVDLVELEEPVFHIAKFLPSVRQSPAPFLFTVQLMVPANPPISLVSTWAAPMNVAEHSPEQLIAQFEEQQGPCPDSVAAFFRNFTSFIQGDGPQADAQRNKRFKLIPCVVQGSWLIKQSVGTTPVILGQKLTTKYCRGKTDSGADYFEVDVDIGSSSVAASITNLVCGATRSLTLDMGVLLEGQEVEHLPEQLIGTIRLAKLDLRTAAYLDDASGRILKSQQGA